MAWACPRVNCPRQQKTEREKRLSAARQRKPATGRLRRRTGTVHKRRRRSRRPTLETGGIWKRSGRKNGRRT